jgi:hypothetical protein
VVGTTAPTVIPDGAKTVMGLGRLASGCVLGAMLTAVVGCGTAGTRLDAMESEATSDRGTDATNGAAGKGGAGAVAGAQGGAGASGAGGDAVAGTGGAAGIGGDSAGEDVPVSERAFYCS